MTAKLLGKIPYGMGGKLPDPEEDTSHKNAGYEKGELMELKELLGDELYGQVEAKINEHNAGIEDKLQHVRYADLSEGNYVSKEKYQEATLKAKGLEDQLSTANNTIRSYKDMDIDGIKRSASEWEEKYNTETEKLNQQIEADRKRFAAERFMDGQKIKSPLSRKAILQEFLAKNLEFKDGAFAGADDFMQEIREKYPDEFEQEEKPEKKTWVRGTRGTYKPPTKSEEEAYLEKKYGKNKYRK